MYIPKNSEKIETPEETHQNQVFLTGLSGLVREHELLSFLKSKVSGVVSVVLPKRSSSGYAFITMCDDDAKQEILKIKNLRFRDRGLQIKEFMEGNKLSSFKKEVNQRRLFVYSIPKRTKDPELRELFAKFGEIEDAYIIRDRHTKKSRCFGYVIFVDTEIAQMVASMKLIPFGVDRNIKVQMHDTEHNNKKKGEEKNTGNSNIDSTEKNSASAKKSLKKQQRKLKSTKDLYDTEYKVKSKEPTSTKLERLEGENQSKRGDLSDGEYGFATPGKGNGEDEVVLEDPDLKFRPDYLNRSGFIQAGFYGGPGCPVDSRFKLNLNPGYSKFGFVDALMGFSTQMSMEGYTQQQMLALIIQQYINFQKIQNSGFFDFQTLPFDGFSGSPAGFFASMNQMMPREEKNKLIAQGKKGTNSKGNLEKDQIQGAHSQKPSCSNYHQPVKQSRHSFENKNDLLGVRSGLRLH